MHSTDIKYQVIFTIHLVTTNITEIIYIYI